MRDATAPCGDIAVSGLAVMGQNLVLNLERNGYNVVVHNRTTSKMTDFAAEHAGKNLIPAVTLEEMVANLVRPRRVLLMVQAGRPRWSRIPASGASPPG